MEFDHVHQNQAEKQSSCALEQGPPCRTKAPLRPKEVWAIRVRLQISKPNAIWRGSTSPSTASFAVAIWLAFESMTSPRAVR